MTKFLVWDELNSSANSALTIDACNEEDAALMYAEQDSDGMTDGLYTREDGRELRHLSDGHPISVQRVGSALVATYLVGVSEFSPVFSAIEKESD